jgi:hypothetical protein
VDDGLVDFVAIGVFDYAKGIQRLVGVDRCGVVKVPVHFGCHVGHHDAALHAEAAKNNGKNGYKKSFHGLLL